MTTKTPNPFTTEPHLATQTVQGPLRYRSCAIERQWVSIAGAPAPDTWTWWHDDYDGAEDARDHRCGFATTLTRCLQDIDECLDEP